MCSQLGPQLAKFRRLGSFMPKQVVTQTGSPVEEGKECRKEEEKEDKKSENEKYK